MLVIDNLSFGFRSRRLFENVRLEIKPGQLVHLVGANGVGKSTFMSIVAGLLAPLSGEVSFRPGSGAAEAAPDRRVYQEYLPAEANGLFLKMDATANLAFWLRLRGEPHDHPRLFQALERWDLNHPLLRDGFSVDKFSTGMKRRLALARLSLSPAPLWLLDEPVYGLDTAAVETFRRLLREHLASGGLALVISHELRPLDGLITHTVKLG